MPKIQELFIYLESERFCLNFLSNVYYMCCFLYYKCSILCSVLYLKRDIVYHICGIQFYDISTLDLEINLQYSKNINKSSMFAMVFNQGVKARTLGRQNERNFCYARLALTSIFGLCFMSVCLIKSNCYSLIHSSLCLTQQEGASEMDLFRDHFDPMLCMGRVGG